MNQTVTLFSGLRAIHLSLIVFLGLGIQSLQAQNVTVNPGGGSYATLGDAFTAINNGTHTGAITVGIIGNTTEAATAVLNASGTGSASYTSINITPTGARTITGNITGNLIDLNGADNVSINGLGTGGNSLTISNTATGASNTIRLLNDATNNAISNARLEGSASTLQFGVVNFGTGTATGNSNNTVSNCDITAAGTNLPINGIFSLGTANIANSNNTVTGCRIFDIFNAASTSIGIHINATNAASSNAWTITNNRLYQTATRVYTTANTHQGIFVGLGAGYTITGNIIGFANATGTGSTNMIGNTVDLPGFPGSYVPTGTPNATRYIAIGAAFTAAGANSLIQNNTVAGFALYTSSGATTTNGILCGINLTAGNATISNNTIGATTGTGSIYTVCTTTGGVVVGIFATSANTLTISNNTVGAIDAMGSTASISGGITAINSAGTAAVTLDNNTVGNTTNPNLRMGTLFNGTNLSNTGVFGIATGLGDFKGIINQASGVVTVTNNTIRNSSLNSSATTADFRGIEMTSGNYTVSNNTITAHTTNSTNATTATALLAGVGILSQGGTAGSLVTQNVINDLSLSNTGTVGTNVAGVAVSNIAINITRNRIWNLRNASTSVTLTTPGSASGIFLRSATTGATMIIENNMITLGTGQTTSTSFIGIWGNHGSSPNPITNIYHNTVRIEGAAASGAIPTFGYHRGNFAVSVVNQVLVDIKNNIFDNARTGGTGPHCAIGNYFNATTTSGVNWPPNASNFNILNAVDPLTVGYWQTAQSFAGWQTASAGDGSSISGATINYINAGAGDLHISFPPSSIVDGAGTPVSTTLDFDGQTRANFSPVDLGADAGIFASYPTIAFTPFGNQCTGTALTLTATITDPDGVPTAGIGLPVLYWRIGNAAYVGVQGVSIGNDQYTFTFGAGVPQGSTVSYYIVAQDNIGNVGSAPSFGASGFTTNPPAASTPPSNPPSYFVNTLNGNYTVGAGGNFTTITAAVNAYNSSCLGGPVTFTLTDATYPSETYPIQINSNPQASAMNTLTIKPGAGVNATINGNSGSATIILNGADFITIDGSNGNTANSVCPPSTATRNLTIVNNNTSAASAVVWMQWFFQNAVPNSPQNNSVINCNIVGNANTTTLVGIGTGSSSISATTLGFLANNIQIINNNISKTQYGIFSIGQSIASKNTGVVINQNLINTPAPDNVLRGGIMALFEDGTQVIGNRIDGISQTSSPDSWGISMGIGVSNYLTTTTTGSEVTNVNVSNNIISNIVNSGTFSAVGIGLASAATGTNTISNNLISGVAANGTASDFGCGIYVGGGAATTNVFHNTVHMSGTITGTSAGSVASLAFGHGNTVAPTALNVFNNIFTNNQLPNASGTTKFMAIGSGFTGTTGNYAGLNSNNNDLWVSGDANHFVGITGNLSTGVTRLTLADWTTETGRDGLSKNFLPVFAGSSDLHLNPTDPINNPLFCGGTQTSVSNDIDCQGRKVTATIGADEISIAGFNAAVAVTETSGTTSNDGTICIGASAILTASGGTSYLWSTAATTAAITVNPATTSTFTVTVTDASGCATAVATTITVNPLPTPGISVSETSGTTSNDGIICNGATATLTASGGTSYMWSNAFTTASINVSPSANTTYTVTVTNANGCSATTTVAITVNALPTPSISVTETSGTTSNDGIICNGASVILTATGGTSYLWSNSFTTASITVSPSANTTYTVTVTDGNGCSATSTRLITVNALPTPSISPANPTICAGSNVTLTASGGTSYVWSTLQTTASIVVNPTSNATYTATVTNANGCSATATVTVNTNPLPQLSATKVEPSTCIATNGSIDLTVTGPGTFTYNWSGPGIQQGQQDQSNLGVGTYIVTVTNTANTCTSSLIQPLIGPGGCDVCPVIGALGAPTGVCNGSSATLNATGLMDMGITYGIEFKYSTTPLANPYVGGTTIATVPNGNLGNSGTTATTNFTFPATGTYIVYAVLSPTPIDPACRPSKSATVGVNPVPVVTAVSNKVHCIGNNVAATVLSSNVTGSVLTWSRTNEAIGLAATSGTGNVPAFTAANATNAPLTSTFTVVATFTANGATCTSAPVQYTITVNPTPTVVDPADQVVCNANPTTAVNFAGSVSGTVYNWTNNNTTIGLAASGSGDIASFNAVNNGTTPVTATVTVTPVFTNAGVTCTGTAQTFTITVNPTPTVNTVANQVRCNGTSTAVINFTGAVSGTVYNWTNNAPGIGLAASGTGNIASFVATNTGTAPVVASIVVTPSYTNAGVTCNGASQTITITVNPTPNVNAYANLAYCSGNSVTPPAFTSTVPGTTFNWTNNNTAIGLGASGTGNLPTFTTANATTGPITATITVTPIFTGTALSCTGAGITFTITINPTPNVAAVANQLLCSESSTNAVNFTGTIPGTVFEWTNNNTAIGLAASGTGSIASFVALNPGTTTLVATITVTPTFTNGGTTCTGTARTFTITVDPLPKVNVGPDITICQDQTASLNAVLGGGAFFGTWSGGAGVFSNKTAPVTVYTPAASEYGQTITLTFTSNDPAGPCPAASDALSLTINTLPIVTAGEDILICDNASLKLSDLGASINANGSGVSTGNWSTSGTGTFQPNSGYPAAQTYTPSAADIAKGFVILRLTSDDPQGPCGPVLDEVRMGFHKETPLTCNNLVHVSLDSDCVGEVLPDDVLEGDLDDYKFYTVELFTSVGVAVPGGNVITKDDLGKTFTVKVTDNCNGNYCWGKVKIEDKLNPVLTCADVTLTCAVTNFTPAYITGVLGIAAGTPTVTDCSPLTTTYKDEFVDLPCGGSINGKNNVSAYIKRDWIVKDAWNNFAECTQYIYLERRSITAVKFPGDIEIPCSSNNVSPSVAGAPFLTDFNRNWPMFPEQASCELSVTHNDQVLPVCGNSYKIIRTWTVYDWCLPTNPGPTGTLNPRYHIQVIKVVDNQGPTIACPKNVTVGTNPFNCCANTDLPDAIISDNCNKVVSIKANISGNDPLTNVPFDYVINGFLSDFPGNNYWNPDTLGNVGSTPCLPLGSYNAKYVAEDLCGNTSSCQFVLTVADLVPPVVACDRVTAVSLASDGRALVNVETFDDGSYDNCCLDYFEGARMGKDCDGGTDDFGPQVEFCCTDVDTVTVIFRAWDCNGNSNDCMVRVVVSDKLKPACNPPANVTTDCENFDPSLWAYGFATSLDNCCVDTVTVSNNYASFDTLCNRGTITRTFRAFDCNGLSNQCTQRILVNFIQDYFVRFPDDRIISTCDGTGNYGEPTFFGKDCEYLAVSFTDEVFTVVPDACFKIERLWNIINWCTYNINGNLVKVPNPNPNATVNAPANNLGPVISAPGTISPWQPTSVKVNPSDLTNTNYSVFYTGGTYNGTPIPPIATSNGFEYKQIIKIIDTQDPVVENCPASPVTICDLTDNNGQLWNESYWWDNTISSHDLCEGPTDLNITATDACSGANITIKYLLFLDLDGDGSMETLVNSSELGIGGLGWNNIRFGSAVGAGSNRAFDERPVLANQKYGFALQTTKSGNKVTAAVRWNTQQNQNTFVVPELPYGTHKIKWIVEDGCGNETVCEYTFVVKDCKAPTVVCINGLSANIMPTKMLVIWASDFLKYGEDNCTPANQLRYSIQKKGGPQVFPVDAQGNPILSLTFTCNELGTQEVELWAQDKAGNAAFCGTYLLVQDPFKNCTNENATVAGAIKTEQEIALEEAEVELAGGPAGFTQNVLTKNDGLYAFAGAPLTYDYTVTPVKDVNPLNGVSTYDLVLISKHILGLEPLGSPYKMIAADANKSNSITTLDIVELRKLILGIYSELPNNTSWRFVDKGFVFPNVLNPFETLFPENIALPALAADKFNQNFTALKVGDVNSSAIANSLVNSEDRTSSTLIFDTDDRIVSAGEEFEMNFKAAERVQGYQFTLNTLGLQVLDIQGGAEMKGENFATFADALTTSFDGNAKGEFTVRFKATKAGKLSEMLQVSNRITRAEAYSLDGERQSVALRFNGSTITGVGFELYQNEPNPFINKTMIGFYLPEAAEATLRIVDETGRVLFAQKGEFAKGHNSIAVERNLLHATGLMYYTLETATHSATKKMIQVK